MNINKEDSEFLIKYVPNAETLMKGDGDEAVNALLRELGFLLSGDWLVKDADGDYNYTELGRQGQEVYDRIYYDA